MTGHTEFDFETAIEATLVNRVGGYSKRAPEDFEESVALFPADVNSFLKASQKSKWHALEKMFGPQTEARIIRELTKQLELKGTLGILRHGFKCYNKMFQLAYFRPNTSMNPVAKANYLMNRLTITRQVGFTSVMKKPDGTNRRCIIDITLAVNGIPVVTAELKNELTGQNFTDAIKQYKKDRCNQDLLFTFKKRALVHFAVDTNEVWMSTQLKGKDTVFLPFNRGNKHGAGNSPVEGNWKTHYLWDNVLQSDSLLEILQKFMHLETVRKQIQTANGLKTVWKETMIFPRYHQLESVRMLVQHAKVQGAGRNYLIQHSPGSGKSNSIAWLAYRLSSLHDANDSKVFHTVVVITDRRVLDQQLQDRIYQFEHKIGVVEKIDENTQQLARALSQGTPIVITTIQKFPFITQALSTLDHQGDGVKIDTHGKRYAVIVDEAHSSQGGETAKALKGILNKHGIEAAIAEQITDVEDDALSEEAKKAILRDSLERTHQPNLSFFAFTATPKFKTMVLFNEPGASGKSPFHEYTMRQAIEEGFILDVLQNYTTYRQFFGLIKQIEHDPNVPNKKATKVLTKYLELHPFNIEQVVSIIIEHFNLHVKHELGGRAKAMVVVGSRLAAVKYKLAFDRYVRDHKLTGIRSLVAFSGSVEDPKIPGSVFTEVSMNDGIAESALPGEFERDEYRVLLVAEKYQTGYDQPLLQTMYIVKKLAGVQAVQTLSRLNRVRSGKARTFILDFVNGEEDIYKAFKPYYETTPIGKHADPHRLSELQYHLLNWTIFVSSDVDAFAEVWYRKKRDHSKSDHRKINSVLDKVVQRYLKRDMNQQEHFRGQLTAYRNLYAFLSQIIPYQDTDLEKLYSFVRNLLAKLPPTRDGRFFVLDDEVSLRYYRLQQMSDGAINLGDGEAEPQKGPIARGTGLLKEDVIALSRLIDNLNEKFGTDFNEADQLFFDQIHASAKDHARVIEAAHANTLKDFSSFLENILDELFIDRMEENKEIFSRIMANQDFRKVTHEYLANEIYSSIRD